MFCQHAHALKCKRGTDYITNSKPLPDQKAKEISHFIYFCGVLWLMKRLPLNYILSAGEPNVLRTNMPFKDNI